MTADDSEQSIANIEDKSLPEKLRNKMDAFGAMLVGSTVQWNGLTNGLIKIEE